MSKSSFDRPTRAEVNLKNIAHNVSLIRRFIPENTKILAVVKANAYGHGMIPVAKTVLENGAYYLGVAILEEGLQIRKAGISAPIIVLGHIFPWEAYDAVLNNITCVVATRELARCLSDEAVKMNKTASIHVKVDTGMGRIGVSLSEVSDFLKDVSKLPNLFIEGLSSHFATADCDSVHTARQLEMFNDLVDKVSKEGYDIPIKHIANTAGAFSMPSACLDMVRIGIALYGLPYKKNGILTEHLRPALELKTKIEFLKYVESGSFIGYGATYMSENKQLIATLPIGYADGYRRELSNKGKVLIRGKECDVVGRICMDQTMVSVQNGIDVSIGDEVVLIGKQNGSVIHVDDVADVIGTISYEILCGISVRVQRIYV